MNITTLAMFSATMAGSIRRVVAIILIDGLFFIVQ